MEDSVLKALKEEMEDGQLDDLEDMDGDYFIFYIFIFYIKRGSRVKEVFSVRIGMDRRGFTDIIVS